MLKTFLNMQISSKSRTKQIYKLRIEMSSSMIISKLQNFAQVIFNLIGTKRTMLKWFLKKIVAPNSFYSISSNSAHSAPLSLDKKNKPKNNHSNWGIDNLNFEWQHNF